MLTARAQLAAGVVDGILYAVGGTDSSGRVLTKCLVGASNQGQFVSCVAHLVDGLRGQHLLVGRQGPSIQRCAARSNPSAPFLGIRTVSERQR